MADLLDAQSTGRNVDADAPQRRVGLRMDPEEGPALEVTRLMRLHAVVRDPPLVGVDLSLDGLAVFRSTVLLDEPHEPRLLPVLPV